MTTLSKWMLAALAATAVAGCDPFEKALTGPPAVTGAGFSEGTFDNGLTAYEATYTAPTWTAQTVPGICSDTTNGVADAPGFIYVRFNELLDGASIQVSPSDCTPTTAMNLIVTPPASTGFTWYACYNPQAPVPTESASVIIFLGPTSPTQSGWSAATPVPASGTLTTTVHATGTVHDKSGAAADFDVTVPISPDATPDAPFVDTPSTDITSTSILVNWTAACVPASSYDLQRAPDNAGTPGAFATITTTTTTFTFLDTGLTPATKYWYRVVVNVTAGGTLTTGNMSVTTAPSAPAAPTFTNLTSTSVTVDWTPVAGALTYKVQRSIDGGTTWVTVAANLPATATSFGVTGLTSATTYLFRIVAVGVNASTNGASASVTTP